MIQKYFRIIVYLIFLTHAKFISAAITNPAPGIFVDLNTVGRQNTFRDLTLLVVQYLLGIVGLVSMVFIIIGGFRYITSRGDEEAAAAGKKTLTNAIIGLIIVILSYVLIVVVINAIRRPN